MTDIGLNYEYYSKQLEECYGSFSCLIEFIGAIKGLENLPPCDQNIIDHLLELGEKIQACQREVIVARESELDKQEAVIEASEILEQGEADDNEGLTS